MRTAREIKEKRDVAVKYSNCRKILYEKSSFGLINESKELCVYIYIYKVMKLCIANR